MVLMEEGIYKTNFTPVVLRLSAPGMQSCVYKTYLMRFASLV